MPRLLLHIGPVAGMADRLRKAAAGRGLLVLAVAFVVLVAADYLFAGFTRIAWNRAGSEKASAVSRPKPPASSSGST